MPNRADENRTGAEHASTGDTDLTQGRSADVPGTMPTGETPKEWKARHRAVYDRVMATGTVKTARIRVPPLPPSD